MVTLRIEPIGFAVSVPASDGADPWMGSNIGALEPKLADGITPIDPVNAAAASLKMSPNILVVSITSNCEGRSVSCMAALSTYMCSSRIPGYAALMAHVCRQRSHAAYAA